MSICKKNILIIVDNLGVGGTQEHVLNFIKLFDEFNVTIISLFGDSFYEKHIKNAGTQILKQFRNNAKVEWKNKYGDELKYIVTFVAGGKSGSVYKADNWSMIGETAGLPKHKSSSMKWDSSESLKEKFVKPTGENKKMIFIKSVL